MRGRLQTRLDAIEKVLEARTAENQPSTLGELMWATEEHRRAHDSWKRGQVVAGYPTTEEGWEKKFGAIGRGWEALYEKIYSNKTT